MPIATDHLAGRRSLGAWAVAVLLWAYYMTPLLVPGHPRPVALVLTLTVPGLIAIALLVFRERAPLATVVLIALCLLFSPAAVGAAFVAQSTIARRGTPARLVISTVVLLGAKVAQLSLAPYAGREWTTASQVEFTICLAGVVIATLAGWLGASRAEVTTSVAETERARRDAETARINEARLAERERLAREMHDVVAHRISLVAMHAGALAYRNDLDPDQTRETARLIQDNAKQSLTELRAVLAGLREEGTQPEPPQPTVADLNLLLADAEDAGQTIEVLNDVRGSLPQQMSRHAFRIIQEGLTNARKHAPGAPVRLELTGRSGAELRLRISNRLADLAVAGTPGARLGLIGVDERVRILGGRASHGVVEGDTFVLTATLPWREQA